MPTPSPFSFLNGLLERLPSAPAGLPRPPQPPQWLVRELQRRVVLLINHVLQQEPQAMERLRAHAGRMALVQWRVFTLALRATPAGLLELADAAAHADLRVECSEGSPLALARGALRGERPPIRVEGDVQLAADIQWLAEHLRWDLEEDLARFVGDVPAHTLASATRRVLDALRGFVGGARSGFDDAGNPLSERQP